MLTIFDYLTLNPQCRHRDETLPLFGSGTPSLRDPDEEEPKPYSIFLPQKVGAIFKKKDVDNKKTKKDYGSLVSKDTEEDEDDISAIDHVPSVGSTLGMAGKPHVPRQNPCLWMFHFIQFTSCVASLCLVATQIIPLVILPSSEIMTRTGALSIALKIYISVFCLMFVVVETDAPVPWIQQSALLIRFFSRGFIYSFIGLVCVEESYSERIRDMVHQKDQFSVGWAAIFMQISSWCMLSVGITYMVLGLFCLKGLRDRLKQKEIDEWKQYRKELKEWKELNE